MATAFEESNTLDLAQNGNTTSEARERVVKRLTNDRQPTAAASSQTWVEWATEGEMLGQPWDATKIPLKKLAQMRRDPILAFALMFVKTPLIRAPWYIKSADPRIAAAVDASLRRIYGRFILAYCNSLDFGFSPIVKRFTYEENPDWVYIPKDDPQAEEREVWTTKTVKPLVWKPFTALDPRRCAPHWDSKGQFNGIDFAQKAGVGAFGTSGFPISTNPLSGYYESQQRQADIPLDWALWATNEKDSEFGNYHGYPRLGYAYRFWWSYWYRFGVADRAFEKWGDPPVIIYHPDDPAAVDPVTEEKVDLTGVALDLAESIRSGANVALPSSVVTSLDEKATGMREWEIAQLQVKTDFNAIGDQFRYLDIQKLRAVMVPEQALVEGEGGTSSRNVASTFGELFQEAQAVVKEEIDDHLNRWVIPQFVEMNFGKDAARAEIVTTGFEQMDMENMRAVLQLVGQRKLLSVVDERELAERMGVPVVSRKEANKRLEQLAAEAEAATPPTIDSQTGTDQAAGVTSSGLYYEPRERIVLSDRSSTPFMIERVDELPCGGDAEAFFEADTRILYVKRDVDPAKVKGYVLGYLAEQVSDGGKKMPDVNDMELIFDQLKVLENRMEASNKETKVQVELQQPEAKEEENMEVFKEVLERDDEGFIKKFREWKEPREKESESE